MVLLLIHAKTVQVHRLRHQGPIKYRFTPVSHRHTIIRSIIKISASHGGSQPMLFVVWKINCEVNQFNNQY